MPFGFRHRQAAIGFGLAFRDRRGETRVRLGLPLGHQGGKALVRLPLPSLFRLGETLVRFPPPGRLHIALRPDGGEAAFSLDMAFGPVAGSYVGGRVFLLLGFAFFVFGDEAAQPLVGGGLLVLRLVGS